MLSSAGRFLGGTDLRKKLAFALALALGFSFAAKAEDALDTLSVRIENVGTRGGQLRVAVFDEAGYNGDMVPVLSRTLDAVAGTVTTTFVGIAPGRYGVRVVQDVSRDKPKTGRLLGLNAPIGYSKLAGASGKPPFRTIQVTVTKGDNTAIVRMQQ